MKKILIVLLSISMIYSSAFARAGKSYSRSSSSSYGSSSSSSYSSPSRSYNTSTYSRPAPTYSRQATPVKRTYSQHKPAQTATQGSTASQPGTVNHTTVNKTTVIHRNDSGSNGYNRNNNNNNNDGGGFGGNNGGGGMGIMGTIAGVGGGIVVGNLLTSALMGDHRNAGHVPAGGYQSTPAGVPLAGQPVAPAMAGAESGNYVTDGKGGVIPAEQYQQQIGTPSTPSSEPTSMSGSVSELSSAPITTEPKSFDWFSWYMWIIYIAFGIGLIMLAISLYKNWRVARDRKNELNDMLEAETNLQLFKQLFVQIQQAYASNSNINLALITTKQMFANIDLERSKTFDHGLTNVVEDITIKNINNVSTWTTDGVKFQQVKIRFSMIDYVVDDNGVVHHGSKTDPETSIEYWTFQSSKKDEWVLNSISQHSGYVHQ